MFTCLCVHLCMLDCVHLCKRSKPICTPDWTERKAQYLFGLLQPVQEAAVSPGMPWRFSSRVLLSQSKTDQTPHPISPELLASKAQTTSV